MNEYGVGVFIDSEGAVHGAREVVRAMDQVATAGKKMGRETEQAADSLKNVQELTQTVGKYLKLAVGGFTVRHIISELSQFDRAMAQVKAQLGGANAPAAQLDIIAAKARVMGATTKSSATEAAIAMKEFVSAGSDAITSTLAVADAADLASVGQMGLAESSKIVLQTIKSFNLEMTDTREVVNGLSIASMKSSADVRQLASGMRLLAPIAASMNVNFRETVVALAAMAESGFEGRRAIMGLSGALQVLGQQSEAMDKRLARFGITTDQISRTMKSEGLLATIDLLAESGLKAGDAMDIWGRRTGTAIDKLMGRRDQFRDMIKQMDNMGLSANEIARVMGDNLGSNLEKLWRAFTNLIQLLGEAGVTGVLNSIVKTAYALVQGLNGVAVDVGRSTTAMRVLNSVGITLYETFDKLFDLMKVGAAVFAAKKVTDYARELSKFVATQRAVMLAQQSAITTLSESGEEYRVASSAVGDYTVSLENLSKQYGTTINDLTTAGASIVTVNANLDKFKLATGAATAGVQKLWLAIGGWFGATVLLVTLLPTVIKWVNDFATTSDKVAAKLARLDLGTFLRQTKEMRGLTVKELETTFEGAGDAVLQAERRVSSLRTQLKYMREEQQRGLSERGFGDPFLDWKLDSVVKKLQTTTTELERLREERDRAGNMAKLYTMIQSDEISSYEQLIEVAQDYGLAQQDVNDAVSKAFELTQQQIQGVQELTAKHFPLLKQMEDITKTTKLLADIEEARQNNAFNPLGGMASQSGVTTQLTAQFELLDQYMAFSKAKEGRTNLEALNSSLGDSLKSTYPLLGAQLKVAAAEDALALARRKATLELQLSDSALRVNIQSIPYLEAALVDAQRGYDALSKSVELNNKGIDAQSASYVLLGHDLQRVAELSQSGAMVNLNTAMEGTVGTLRSLQEQYNSNSMRLTQLSTAFGVLNATLGKASEIPAFRKALENAGFTMEQVQRIVRLLARDITELQKVMRTEAEAEIGFSPYVSSLLRMGEALRGVTSEVTTSSHKIAKSYAVGLQELQESQAAALTEASAAAGESQSILSRALAENMPKVHSFDAALEEVSKKFGVLPATTLKAAQGMREMVPEIVGLVNKFDPLTGQIADTALQARVMQQVFDAIKSDAGLVAFFDALGLSIERTGEAAEAARKQAERLVRELSAMRRIYGNKEAGMAIEQVMPQYRELRQAEDLLADLKSYKIDSANTEAVLRHNRALAEQQATVDELRRSMSGYHDSTERFILSQDSVGAALEASTRDLQRLQEVQRQYGKETWQWQSAQRGIEATTEKIQGLKMEAAGLPNIFESMRDVTKGVFMEIGRVLGDAFTNLIMSVFDGFDDFRRQIRSLLKSIVATIINFVVQQKIILPLFMQIAGFIGKDGKVYSNPQDANASYGGAASTTGTQQTQGGFLSSIGDLLGTVLGDKVGGVLKGITGVFDRGIGGVISEIKGIFSGSGGTQGGLLGKVGEVIGAGLKGAKSIFGFGGGASGAMSIPHIGMPATEAAKLYGASTAGGSITKIAAAIKGAGSGLLNIISNFGVFAEGAKAALSGTTTQFLGDLAAREGYDMASGVFRAGKAGVGLPGTIASVGAGLIGSFGGAKLGDWMGGDPGRNSWMSAAGTVIGSLTPLGPILGSLVGGAIGGAISGALGGKKKVTGEGFIFGIGAGGVGDFDTYTNTKKKRGLFGGYGSTRHSIEEQAEADEAFTAAVQSAYEAMKLLGVTEKYLREVVVAQQEISLRGLTPEQAQQRVTETFAETMIKVLDEADGALGNLSERFLVTARRFTSSLDEFLEGFAVATALEAVLTTDVLKEAEKLQSTSNFDQFADQVKLLRDLIFPSSPGLWGVSDLADVASQFGIVKAAAAGLISALMDLRREMEGIFSSTAQRIRESQMAPEQIYAERQRMFEEAVAGIGSASDPATIRELASRANAYLEDAFFNLLDDTQRASLADQYLAQINSLSELVSSRIGDVISNTQAITVELDSRVTELMLEAANNQIVATNLLTASIDKLNAAISALFTGSSASVFSSGPGNELGYP